MTDIQVDGITKSDFQGWRHHPVSKLFLKFLDDKRKFLGDHVFDLWISGSLTLQAEDTMRGQIIELFELKNMEFDAIANFYQMDKEETDNAA